MIIRFESFSHLQPAGFSIEITKTTNTTVMVGVRVLVGSQSIDRAPTYLEVFGRTTQVIYV